MKPIIALLLACVVAASAQHFHQSGGPAIATGSAGVASRPATMPRFVGPPHPLDIDGDGVIEWTAPNPHHPSSRVEDSDLRLFVFHLLEPRDEIGLPRGESHTPGWGPANAEFKRCDLNGDGLVDGDDVQRAVELAP